ncbi:MAG TPA: alpha/beta fold hydrolase [Gaiellaceae bacterium]|nr:alpha/beta fold hydrolase [Gaiellaceae bacterium]
MLHVREWGSEGGQALVFWHALGTGTSGAYLTEVAPVLVAAGLRVVAPDAPGFGESPALPRERYETESVVELLRGVLDERGVERAILMGHSWGGTVVTAFAARHPARVEGLVLVDSGHADYQDQPGFPHGTSFEQLVEEAHAPERRIRVRAEDFEREAQDGVRRPVTPELLEAFRAGVRREGEELVSIVTPEVRASAVWGLMGTRVTESWPALAEARIPILLLLATEPEEVRERNEADARRFRERFPDAEIVFVDRAGHDLFADAGPELGRVVAAWAGRLARR